MWADAVGWTLGVLPVVVVVLMAVDQICSGPDDLTIMEVLSIYPSIIETTLQFSIYEVKKQKLGFLITFSYMQLKLILSQFSNYVAIKTLVNKSESTQA
jgi:hypothetical protein